MAWRKTTNDRESPPELPTERDLEEMALEMNVRLFCDFPAEGAFIQEKILWVDSITAAVDTPGPGRKRRGGLLAALLRWLRRLLRRLKRR